MILLSGFFCASISTKANLFPSGDIAVDETRMPLFGRSRQTSAALPSVRIRHMSLIESTNAASVPSADTEGRDCATSKWLRYAPAVPSLGSSLRPRNHDALSLKTKSVLSVPLITGIDG